jgi:23S rRNA (uracil1939-C5)-methyltransferase
MTKDFTVRIDSMAYRGYGVARLRGKILFVAGVISGEEIEGEIEEEKKDYSFGRVKCVLEPSRSRVAPLCPYFGQCGGCQWQHIDYGAQVSFKREILEETLRRLGGLGKTPEIALLPSARSYGYRIRVQLKIEGERIGYFRERSHEVIDIRECPISHPLINEIIGVLHEHRDALRGIKEIEVNISPEEDRGILLIHASRPYFQLKQGLTELLHSHPVLKGIAFFDRQRTESLGKARLQFTVPLRRNGKEKPVTFGVSPGSFFQIQLEEDVPLIQRVLQFGEPVGSEKVLDLYSGIGNFSIPLALGRARVVGIEENRAAISDARANAAANGVEQCRFIRGRVENVLKTLDSDAADLIVLDPPRTGCREALPEIIRLKPARLVYVSCEPTTFSRDLRSLLSSGYGLEKLALADLFPQSYRMETVALLSRTAGS